MARPTLLARVVNVRPGELPALLLSFAYFFFLLCGYYVLRPIRDEMGISRGVDKLPILFTGTFVAMALASPLFGALASRWPRRRLVAWAYHFFALDVVAFHLAWRAGVGKEWLPFAFYIWAAVYNLFVVSVFWSVMTDLFSVEQAKRLFGFVAAGGSAGALAGPLVTALLVAPLGAANLLLVSAGLLELAVLCLALLLRVRSAPAPLPDPLPAQRGEGDGTLPDPLPARRGEGDGTLPDPLPAQRGEGRAQRGSHDPLHPRSGGRVREGGPSGDERPLGGTAWSGIRPVVASPYLLASAAYMFLLTVGNTFLYFQQADLVSAATESREARTRIFARIDLLVNAATVLLQTLVTGRFLKRLGVGAGLSASPLLTAGGFAVLAVAPVLPVLALFQGIRRALQYAILRPSRELLFTVVSREERYKSKNFIDTVVFRGGDMLSGWVYSGLAALGLGVSGIAWVGVPLGLAWLALALYLGREQRRRAAAAEEGMPEASAALPQRP